MVAIAALFMIAAGAIHLVLAPLHWAHAPAHGMIMAVSGVLEVLWGAIFWRRPSANSSRVGLIIAVSLITLWAITRVAPAPFGHGPEEIDALGIISKVCEGLGAAALLTLTLSAGALRAQWRTAVAVVGVAIITGWASYGMALAAEPLFPTLAHHHDAVQGDVHADPDHHHD